MQKVRVEDAVGMVLAHDITRIVPGEFKGAAFRKGHIIREEDINSLLDLGKEHIYIWENKEGWLHENEAVEAIVKATAGAGVNLTEPREGKIIYEAAFNGILKIDVNRLIQINSVDQIVLSTLHNNRPVERGQMVASARIVPLIIEEEKIREVQEIAGGVPVIEVKPLLSKRVGIVTTGSEVYKGRIKDAFGPTLQQKLNHYGCEVIRQTIVPDDPEMIKEAIREMRSFGAELILTTGGMSVDPDDLTPSSIRDLGAKIVAHGSPVLPGSQFMMAYWDDIPVMGLPGCVMYSRRTIFDLILPRVLAGEIIKREDLTRLAHGGLCLNCEVCTYPNCGFGKS
ncbi:MAG: molybdopterin-binding protein [Clostridia bacterium]|nr:molybdopterin-binding protein [Clostridia bacterium]